VPLFLDQVRPGGGDGLHDLNGEMVSGFHTGPLHKQKQTRKYLAPEEKMEAKNLIGKTCIYRPAYTMENKTSEVVAVNEYENIAGRPLTVVVMENGDKVGPQELFFPKSSTA
jgi:hypothetical protein